MDEEEPKHQNLEELENLRGCSTKQGKQDSDSVFTIFVDNLSKRVSMMALRELFNHHGKVGGSPSLPLNRSRGTLKKGCFKESVRDSRTNVVISSGAAGDKENLLDFNFPASEMALTRLSLYRSK
ncbi:hypothetical protein V6N13_104835 [Hibiscus sabdariffa]|uniref:RRM domain-containing protein n=1 Tax=Hibiscus sabdariffa TaxID=183260 RepID=A0ABR2CJ84_9ROSI